MPYKEKQVSRLQYCNHQNIQSRHFQICKSLKTFSPTCLLSGSHWRMRSTKMRQKCKKKEDMRYNKVGNQQRKEAKMVKKSQGMIAIQQPIHCLNNVNSEY